MSRKPRDDRAGSAPTINDVAGVAGVSVATVSRSLSRPELVLEETRRRVEAAITQTGYSVNALAQSLRRQRVGSILALVPNIANPFFSEVLAGISQEVRKERVNLLVLDTRISGEPQDLAPYLNLSRCDGVIALDGALPAGLFGRANSPPVVQACEWIVGLDAPMVLARNSDGGLAIARHLIALGHRRIAHLAGPQTNTLSISRRAGFVAGLTEAGLALEPALVFAGDFSLDAGRTCGERLLALGRLPDAVFCDNDEMACGLIGALSRGGLRVPQDISVAGFDDIALSAHTLPSLTTVAQPRFEIGQRAAQVLRAKIAGEPYEAETLLPVTLIQRESTAAPARARPRKRNLRS